ncbi:hypothetical protein EDB85DRAFT_1895288 [Lactarius pseudohatsudake]|nr:hypothetical protein EDB85DRAFT_1895288 [Lactarius pseudohatsudake]
MSNREIESEIQGDERWSRGGRARHRTATAMAHGRLHEVVILVVEMEMDQEHDEGNICSEFWETTPEFHRRELLDSSRSKLSKVRSELEFTLVWTLTRGNRGVHRDTWNPKSRKWGNPCGGEAAYETQQVVMKQNKGRDDQPGEPEPAFTASIPSPLTLEPYKLDSTPACSTVDVVPQSFLELSLSGSSLYGTFPLQNLCADVETVAAVPGIRVEGLTRQRAVCSREGRNPSRGSVGPGVIEGSSGAGRSKKEDLGGSQDGTFQTSKSCNTSAQRLRLGQYGRLSERVWL